MPAQWREGILVPLHKKGDRADCGNYRGICLLTVGYKIFAKIVYERLSTYCEEMVGDYQAGFRRGRSTIDQIFAERQIMEKYYEFDRDNWHLFIDFRQAYDSIHRPSMWGILSEFDIPAKLIRVIKRCYENNLCKVRVGGRNTEVFGVEGGLKQGCALSTLLFNFALEWVMRQTPVTAGVRLDGVKYDRLAYADDVDMMAERMEDLNEVAQTFAEAASRLGLKINEGKTKIMRVSREQYPVGEMVRCGDMEVELVGEFKYLGSTMTSGNEVGVEIKARIASGARCLYSMKEIMKRRIISRGTKFQIYKTIIRPVVTYGCETWRLTRELERKLQVFENSVMRRICGPVFDVEEGVWRRRHNRELREIAKMPTIVQWITSQRLRWAGHVARMEEGRMIGNIARGTPEGRRPVGRPRMRWRDNVKRDVGALGAETPEDWWDLAQSREQWRHLVLAAKDQGGPQPAECLSDMVQEEAIQQVHVDDRQWSG
jgi:sorting nexin-29